MRSICALLLALLPTGACSSYTLHLLATADIADAIAPTNEVAVISDRLPPIAAAPYAVLACEFAGQRVRQHCAAIRRQLEARELRPDFVLYLPAGTVATGSIGVARVVGASGVVVGSESQTFQHRVQAVLFRALPWRIGVETDDDDMVVALDDEPRRAGLLEGDTLVAVNGDAYATDQATDVRPFWLRAAAVRPGDRITLEWIRPGTGRMNGECSALPPQPWPPGFPTLDEVDAQTDAATGN